jgi:hypothetical protein
VDRRKQGGKRSVVTDATGILLGAIPAPANRRDDGLLGDTLDTLAVLGPLPIQPTVHLDAGTTTSPVGMSWPAAAWSARSPSAVSPPPSRPAGAGWWSAPTPGPTSTASCAGAPSVAGWWCSSGWHWLAPSSSLGGWFAAPGPSTGGKAVHDDGRSSH